MGTNWLLKTAVFADAQKRHSPIAIPFSVANFFQLNCRSVRVRFDRTDVLRYLKLDLNFSFAVLYFHQCPIFGAALDLSQDFFEPAKLCGGRSGNFLSAFFL